MKFYFSIDNVNYIYTICIILGVKLWRTGDKIIPKEKNIFLKIVRI